jgi:NADPH:quinone reductase-like Zn-dependent oxidoreductase
MNKAGGSGSANWFKLASGFLRTPKFSPLEMTNDSKSVLAFNLSYLYDRRDILDEAMIAISDWLAKGSIVPPTVTAYPLDRAGDAHRDIESGKTIGKLVLVMPS